MSITRSDMRYRGLGSRIPRFRSRFWTGSCHKVQRFGHLHAVCRCDLSQLPFLTLSLLLLPLINLILRFDTNVRLHVPEPCLVMMGVRVRVFIVLRNIFELLIAETAVEGLEGIEELVCES